MSQHSTPTRYHDQKVEVVAGYDRPLNDLFLQVLSDADEHPAQEERVLYSSIHEPLLDWTDINTLSAKLVELGIEVPENLLEAVYLDQIFHVGNLVVRHHHNQAPEVLLAG